MIQLDPDLDLQLDRYLDAAPEKVFRCWTEPALICQWFCPKPWFVSEAVVDPRPGGRFFTLTNGPDGEVVPNEGALLEIVPDRKLVFTDMFRADWRPAPDAGLGFAAIVTMEPEGAGTRYRAIARHRRPDEAETHRKMGFHDGWGTAADQLVEIAKGF